MRYRARASISVPIVLVAQTMAVALVLAAAVLVVAQAPLHGASPMANRVGGDGNLTKDQQKVSVTEGAGLGAQNSPTATTTTPAQQQPISSKHQNNQGTQQQHQKHELKSNTSNDCSQPCSNAEFASILNKISLNVDILRDFQRNELLGTSGQQQQKANSTSRGASAADSIRPECIKQLIQMIKKLASGELEMKTLLEFASSTAQINLRSDLTYLRASYAQERQTNSEDNNNRNNKLTGAAGNCGSQPATTTATAQSVDQQNGAPLPATSVEYLLGDEPNPTASDVDSKAQFLPKLVASVDQWLDTIERFTLTREWDALMRVFNGLESILGMFSANGSPVKMLPITSNSNSGQKSNSTTAPPQQANQTTTNSSLTVKTNSTMSNTVVVSVKSQASNNDPNGPLVATLERELPNHVQILTGSLNQLFPWHVWPWNNIDLYSTVDTFMNHGIFAFSKTTAGPERRIDYLPQMLDSLFKSLKWDSFPKKCNDWSRMICDLESFYDGLAVAPLQQQDASTSSSDELRQRKEQVRKLVAVPENKLTQELVCIMFSSLSMQQFGAKDIDFNAFNQENTGTGNGDTNANNQPKVGPANQLRWDRQVRKALKLYRLSREALNDGQWMALQRQLNDLWSQMKISDRVIMVGRIIQLLTNCHMPREILESALWKDIYKYKNALNQIGDIVIEELNRSSENGQFTIAQLAIGSKHLEDILTRFVRLLPRLLESLSRTITNELPELVSKFFDEKIAFFKGPCKGHSFGELVPSLAGHHAEIAELERLVCEQLSTKPSITMMQINNLTNEFLAMALNFTNFGGSLPSLPRLWSNNNQQQQSQMASPNKAGPVVSQSVSPSAIKAQLPTAPSQASTVPVLASSSSTTTQALIKEQLAGSNGTQSIIDELAANPRLAQIVAILQSSALDPPEVHAELPELDWVEAGTSVALFYESIQKLMSYEGLFVVFPEVRDFQEEMQAKLEHCKQMFTEFGKRDPIRLASYSMDTVMPIALRTYQPLDSFHAECLSTFRDIFGETDFGSQQQQQLVSRESRQWQCAVSATNFASFALNNLIRTFNGMLRNILAQMSRQRDLFKFKQQQQQQQPSSVTPFGKLQAQEQSFATASGSANGSGNTTANLTACVLFDGSVTTLMDNLPQLVDLALETFLIGSTNVNQRQTLKETLCAFENTLDPLAEGQLLQRQVKLREAVCHLLHESSLTACAEVLLVDQWTGTMRRLNVTWFETSAVSVEPSFRGIISGVHEFLDLFGKVKPSSMSDGLLARVLNFNSYWTGLVNKAVSSFEKYKERRFQVALQILMPIIYENVPVFRKFDSLSNQQQYEFSKQQNDTRHSLKLAIFGAKSVQLYLGKSEQLAGPTSVQQQQQNSTPGADSPQATAANSITSKDFIAKQQDLIDGQLRTLFDWADKYLVVMSECLLRTVAGNLTKLELLTSESRGSPANAWKRFCSAPIDTYLQFDATSGAGPAEPNKAGLTSQARLVEANEARLALCAFEWAKLEERLIQINSYNTTITTANTTVSTQAAANLTGASTTTTTSPIVVTPLDAYSTKQLVRVALTKWGQVIDLIAGSFSPAPTSVAGQPSVAQMSANNNNKLITRNPKFLTLSHWKPLQEKLPTFAPSQYDPTNFIWVWQALERLVNSADSMAQSGSGSESDGTNNQSESAIGNTTTTASSSNSTTNNNIDTTDSTSEALIRIFDQLNCALDTVKGGITWDNMVNIYQDRQDVLAAHSTLNNGIALASAGANTFLAHKKFQKFLNNFVRPRMGLTAFCEMRDKSRLEGIFSLSTAAGGEADYKQEANKEELIGALESFQEFVCDTNLETLVQNINPISVCYQSGTSSSGGAQNQTAGSPSTNGTTAPTTTTTTPTTTDDFPLAQTMDRFFKLASLAVLDAKLVDTNDAKPPIFDKSKWDQLRRWWLNQTEVQQGNSGLALTLVRVFQTLDSINSEHVVWRAIFRSFHELSEVSAYLLRAAEMELQATVEQRERGQPTKLALIREAAEQMDTAIKLQANSSLSTSQKLGRNRHQQQQLASTIANVMFPEVSNFITLRTFKQLRYIKSISDYFATAPGAQELICRNLTARARSSTNSTNSTSDSINSDKDDNVNDDDGDDDDEQLFAWGRGSGGGSKSKFELIGYKLNSSKRLYALLCHYHSSQWLTAMNIVLTSKTSSLTKKVNYMTKYLSLFTKNYEHSEHLQSFIHGQQMENIEAVANKTVSYMIALSQPFRTLTISKISNISWHSIPNLLESIDKHLCASKYEQQQQQQQHSNSSAQQQQPQQPSYQLAVYEPKKPDIEVIICKLPSWNITQVYNYFSENIDLQNMISLATQNNHTAKLFGIVQAASHQVNDPDRPATTTGDIRQPQQQQQRQPPTCITPFKFASKWLKIVQDLIDEFMSKASKEKIRKCLNSNKKSNSAYLQTMKYVKVLNSLLATLNDLTRNNSWPVVRRTWNSISYAILNQSGSAPLAAVTASTTTTLAATTTTGPGTPAVAPLVPVEVTGRLTHV